MVPSVIPRMWITRTEPNRFRPHDLVDGHSGLSLNHTRGVHMPSITPLLAVAISLGASESVVAPALQRSHSAAARPADPLPDCAGAAWRHRLGAPDGDQLPFLRDRRQLRFRGGLP